MAWLQTAFPVIPPLDPASGGVAPGYPMPSAGATLRDLFALHIAAGLAVQDRPSDSTQDSYEFWTNRIATRSYSIADAMLKARDQ